jgi:hypothetical protein
MAGAARNRSRSVRVIRARRVRLRQLSAVNVQAEGRHAIKSS